VKDQRENFYFNSHRNIKEGLWGKDHIHKMDLITAMALSHDLVLKSMEKVLEPYNLSLSGFNAMCLVKHNPNSKMSDLGQLMIVSSASITSLIDFLENRNYVIRVQDEEDRRSKFLQITDQGLKVVEEIIPKFVECQKKITEKITVEESKVFLQVLEKMRHSAHSQLEAILK
jgi:MarR family 2-MHQ and catechol resistance regulon transcriptional repressor